MLFQQEEMIPRSGYISEDTLNLSSRIKDLEDNVGVLCKQLEILLNRINRLEFKDLDYE